MAVQSKTDASDQGVRDTGAPVRRSAVGLHQIPNTLCVTRVILVFASLYFISEIHRTEGRWSVLWLCVISAAALTDRLDGFLAKRFGWTSAVGAYLDHISVIE